MFIQSYIGIIIPFAGNYAPQSWMLCDGRQLPISEYDVLYTLLGTTFGGDGVNTFALPNLCGRVAIHSGQGSQMQYYVPGQIGGQESVSITTNNLPVHTHQLNGSITAQPPCSNANGTTNIPTGNYPAILNGAAAQYSTAASDTIGMGATSLTAQTPAAPVVKDQPKEPIQTMSPFLAMNYIICVEGIFPPHS
jgi:microcystin-dependent protein